MNFIILITSFIIALLGFIQSNRADPNDVAFLGLTRIGMGMICIAALGFSAGLIKEYKESIKAKEAESREVQTSQQIKIILAKLDGIQQATDPETSTQIGKVVEGLNSVASLRRYSDFRMSDFSKSNFSKALFKESNFDRASFANASMKDTIFPNADLSGADLSRAIIDKNTKLPKQ